MQLRRIICTTVAACMALANMAAQSGINDLTITVLEGEDGANIVKDQTFAETVVEVRDKNNLPVAAAAVTFTVAWAATHKGGATPGSFAGGGNTLTVSTDANGRAVMTGFRPQGTGAVNVQVQASYQGHVGTTVIHQANFPTAQAAQAAGKNSGSQAQTNSLRAASQGMSTGAKVALVTVGAAAAGGAGAYGAGLFNTAPDCSAQANQWLQVTQQFAQVCQTNEQSQQCVNQVNAYLNAANSFCSCVGGLGSVPDQYRQAIVDGLNNIRNAFGASASAPACR